MNIIAFTKARLPYGWLGNMTQYPIRHAGVTWPTGEHLFQALRLPQGHPAISVMLESNNPMSAKFTAKVAADQFVVEPLSEADLENMRLVVRLKTEQHSNLSVMLQATGDALIIEDVTNRMNKGSAKFWGAGLVESGRWVGENWLGRIWMEQRAA